MRTRGFTLVELLVVIAIIGVMVAMIAPAIMGALAMADQTACASNLHQLGLAMQMYLKDHDGRFFPLRTIQPDGTLWYYGFEATSSLSAGEGNRTFDRTQGKLYPYLQSDTATVEVCPAFYAGAGYKPKYQGQWWTYGINFSLSNFNGGRCIDEVRASDVTHTIIFADSAQVNTWQAPASPSCPLAEEWFYIQPGQRMVHFRHLGKANVLMADWHVEALPAAPGSYNPLMKDECIGYFDAKRVLFEPKVGK
jgi:prepilin-type N-terminal cleavage/methylation domain-containing protein/prepilin-type processing-associated H-X9-DG protein